MFNPNENLEGNDDSFSYEFTQEDFELTEEDYAEMGKQAGQISSDDIFEQCTKEREAEIAQQLNIAKEEKNLSYLSKVALFIAYCLANTNDEKK